MATAGQQKAGDIKVAIETIIGGLEKEAERRVSRRSSIEDRWIEDTRQYHGEYDESTLSDLSSQNKSQLFINQTRPKTNACSARLFDMLFPTDDKNWDVQPTPVPELSNLATQATSVAEQGKELADRAIARGDMATARWIVEESNAQLDAGVNAQSLIDEAKRRCDAMREEMEDQLRECRYAEEMRLVLEDACKLGTGIAEGPVVNDRVRRNWTKSQLNNGAEVYELKGTEDARPAFRRINPWDFFPDMDAMSPEESEGFFIRHLETKKGLRKLAREPGFDKDAIRELLRESPRSKVPTYISELREISGNDQDSNLERYTVWKYTGPITAEDLEALVEFTGQEKIEGETDPLKELPVTIWFSQGKLLKFGIYHMDSGDPIYSVFPFEKDDSSMFGKGVPCLMRDSQKALNAAWRMMMDNSGLSSGPQVEIDPTVIEPVDGEWGLAPRKLWKRLATALPGKKGMETYEIESHQQELANIITLAKQFIDDESSMSVLAQGEQGSHTTQTAGGMSILMNAVNVVFRRIVKNFDDCMTVPNLRRLYDWNMQFSTKEDIKGDFEVDARGSSVLLVREIQSQNLMALTTNWSGHPVLGLLLKAAPAARKTVQSLMIAANEIIKTDDELKAEEEARANQEQPEDPAVTMKRMELEDRERDRQHKERMAAMQRDTEMVRLSAQTNVTLDKIRAQLQDSREERASSERKFAAEVAVEKQNKEEALARGDEPQGSGGFVSQ